MELGLLSFNALNIIFLMLLIFNSRASFLLFLFGTSVKLWATVCLYLHRISL